MYVWGGGGGGMASNFFCRSFQMSPLTVKPLASLSSFVVKLARWYFKWLVEGSRSSDHFIEHTPSVSGSIGGL